MDATTFIIVLACITIAVLFVLLFRAQSNNKELEFENSIQRENVATLRTDKVRLAVRNENLKHELRQAIKNQVEAGNPGTVLDGITSARGVRKNKDGG